MNLLAIDFDYAFRIDTKSAIIVKPYLFRHYTLRQSTYMSMPKVTTSTT